MLPVLVDALPTGPGWLFELKWDGVRVLALRAHDRVELWSRKGLPVSEQYPEVAAAIAALPGGDLALDGEIVALDGEGRPSFERLQRRMHLVRAVDRAAAGTPVTAYFYDCLALFGRDVRALALEERKTLVRGLLADPGTLRYVDHVEGEGQAFFDAVCAAGLEGVVAKRVDGPYRGGRRPEWRKIKCHQRQEFVIGGYTDPKGTRAYFGALHVGFYERGSLVYAGRAGSGLDASALQELHGRLRALATARCPFGRATHRSAASTTGCGPSWCARCGSRSGRPRAFCVTPCISGYGPIAGRGTSAASERSLHLDRDPPAGALPGDSRDVMSRRLRGARDVGDALWVVEEKIDLLAAPESLQPQLGLRPAEGTFDAAKIDLGPHLLAPHTTRAATRRQTGQGAVRTVPRAGGGAIPCEAR